MKVEARIILPSWKPKGTARVCSERVKPTQKFPLHGPNIRAALKLGGSACKFVTETQNGQDQPRLLGVTLKLLAQSCYVNIDRARACRGAVPPHVLKQFAAGERSAAVLDEVA